MIGVWIPINQDDDSDALKDCRAAVALADEAFVVTQHSMATAQSLIGDLAPSDDASAALAEDAGKINNIAPQYVEAKEGCHAG